MRKTTLFSALLIAGAISGTAHSAQDCALTQAMGERKAEVRQRNTELNRLGIQERNASVIDNLPTISKGACLDKIHDVMDTITESSGVIGGLLGLVSGRISNMTCREADRFYRDVMRTKLGEIDDRFGLIRSGEITGYQEGRKINIDVGRAIELGRRASDAARGVPLDPPGRGGTQEVAPRSPASEGVRDALKGL